MSMQGSYKILQNIFYSHFQQLKQHSLLALSSEKIGFALEIKNWKLCFHFVFHSACTIFAHTFAHIISK